MTQLNINVDFEELASAIFESNLNTAMKSIAVSVLNAYMEMERDQYVNADFKQKNPKRIAQRNGYYERDFMMPVGKIHLKVPRTRDGEFTTDVFEQYTRSDQSLILAMMEAYINGVSTRNITKIVEALSGESVSKSTISEVMKNIDPDIQEWASRPITNHQYKYVFVDAMYIKVRENNKIVSKGVYTAMGINELRQREIIGFKISNQESEKAWSEFFEDLRMRGLTTPELIISDAHSGLIKSIKSQFIDSSWQRCTFHFLKNIVERFPKKNSEDAKLLLKSIFKAPTYQHALQLKEELITKYQNNPKYSEALNILDQGFEDAAQFYRFPAQHHKSLRTTNSIENINMQVRKREKVIKTFPNLDSAFRLIGAVLMDIQENFDSSKRPFIT
ncbi:IS256 family transposase [Mammaliicoccus fleurettii]|uniref:IS256 family transposase n=8 Tax=Mammaliicoccus TaxID=2803850 RepID=UPI002DB6C8A8|nr:IS256 family transposase [Mammaliicoccus fleurettii]MEB7724271.1 IS256 family transposase [Mammaliicoccus fleurettii]